MSNTCKRFTLAEVEIVGSLLHVNPSIISPAMLTRGMNVELEHGTIDPRTNVTNDIANDTAKIALAHFKEGTNYYELLEAMEKKLKRPKEIFTY